MLCTICEKEFKKIGKSNQCSVRCRILANVKIENGCWIWQGQFWHKRKYGRIRGHRKDSKYSDRAHVASYQYHKGGTNGLYVCHTCDNPSCINPEHLWLGTNQENQLDAVRKGGRWKRKI